MTARTPALAAMAAAFCLTAFAQPASGMQAQEPPDPADYVKEPAADQIETVEETVDEPPVLYRDDLFGNPERTQGRISPDGQYVSWLAPKDGVMNIWVAPADNPDDARAITEDTGRGIALHRWAPDGQSILFPQDKGGNENYHIYAAKVDGSGVRNLTPIGEDARASIAAISRLRPDAILVGTNERNPQLFDLYSVDLESGERSMVAQNPGYADWLIDHDLKPRFGVKPNPDGGFTLMTLGDEPEAFLEIPAEDALSSGPIGFAAGNAAIYMLDSRGRDTAALVEVDVVTGDKRVIAENEKADISEVLIHPQSYEPIAYGAKYLTLKWTALDETMADDLAVINEKIEGAKQFLATTDEGDKIVVYAETATAPGTYYLYDREADTATKLFTTRPELEDDPLQPMHPREIAAGDGLTLTAYLTLPPGSDPDGDGVPDEAKPMVLYVHGGPWARDSYGYNATHQWLANRGYAVLSVNYRGSTGFGKDFLNAAVGEFAGAMHQDLIDAVNWAIEEGIAQSEKVAIMGGSYGGYATLVGLSFTPETFACGVDIVGPSSLVTLIESFPDYWKPYLDATWYKFVGDPTDPATREKLLSKSPITKVDNIEDPLLIGQGENDPRVTKTESDQIVEIMQDKDLPVTYVNFPDEGHGFQRPQNRLSFYAVADAFLAECLDGRYEPIGDDFTGSSIEVLAGADFIPGLPSALEAINQP